jgi:alginate O-acetyltransferase complex protein AlgJ
MRVWKTFVLLPLLIGAAAMLVPAALLLANLAAESVTGRPIVLFARLYGVEMPVTPTLTLGTLLHGDFQAEAARLAGPLTPVFPLAVRVKSELFYRLFRQSGSPYIDIGRGGELIEHPYIDEYCKRDLALFQIEAQAWLPHLLEMQEEVERRGKQFLYVITPSKVAQYPQFMPSGMRCPAPASARLGLLPMWRGMLDHAGVRYVDTTASVTAAKQQFPIALFPRGGAHWNMIGAAVAAQAIEAGLNASRSDKVFAPFTFTWTPAPAPIYPDDELSSLLNQLQPDLNFVSPLVTFHDEAPLTPCHPITVALVGGSFLHQPGAAIAQGTCRPHMEMWEYWTAYHITWPLPLGFVVWAGEPVEAAERDRNILAADVVIYEENEQLLARTRHGPLLYAFLKAHAAADRER